MTVTVWRLASDTAAYEAYDLSGKGAEMTGGRWNRKGRPVVYTANSIALACLETVVHLNAATLPLNRFVVRIDVPDDVWAARTSASAQELPVGWSASPPGMVSLNHGDNWLRNLGSALLVVPSVIVHEETNILINPLHPGAQAITATKVRPWFYDPRLREQAT